MRRTTALIVALLMASHVCPLSLPADKPRCPADVWHCGPSPHREDHDDPTITRQYHHVPMGEALKELGRLQRKYTINFIYDELEGFLVTTSIRNKSVPDAIRQMIGFYPIRMAEMADGTIYVESASKCRHRYKGTILDEKGRPLPCANVVLLSPSDSTVVAAGVSSEGGLFVIPCDADTVLARVSYVGCKTVYRHSAGTHLGTIRLQRETHALRGVTVKGGAPVLRREEGKMIFHTRHIAGATNATELLRYAPGVMLADDDITLFGAGGVVVCVNGIQQHADTREVLRILRSYAASDVEKIEIMQSPGASHSASGYGGVVNLVLKKKGSDYVGGSAGYAHTQYEEHGDEAQASVVYNKGRTSASLSVAASCDHTRYEETSDVDFSSTRRHGTDQGRLGTDDCTLRWQMDYKVSHRLSIGAYATYGSGKRRLSVDGLYDFLPKAPHSISSIGTQTQRIEDTQTWTANVNASQRIGRREAKIDYNLDFYRMRMDDTRHSTSTNTLTGNSISDFHQSDTTDFDYQNRIAQTVDNFAARVDANIAGFRLGTKYAFTRSHRDLGYSGVGTNSHERNNYDELLWAAHLEYAWRFGRAWSAQAGGRYEHVWTRASNWPEESGNRSHYGRLFPTLQIAYKPHPDHSLSCSLTSRVTRPNLINLNPNWIWKDVSHVSFGNQHLKPSYLYKAVMGYTFKGFLGADVYFGYEPDRIDALYHVDEQLTTNSWGNITDRYDFGISSFLCLDKLSWLTATLTQGVGYARTVRRQGETVLGAERRYSHPEVDNVGYTGTLQATFFLDTSRQLTASLYATYASPQKDVVRYVQASYRVDATLQYRFWKDRLSLSVACRNLLASRYKGTVFLGTTAMDFDNRLCYRQLRLTLTCHWGARMRQSRRQYEGDGMKERVANDF